MLRQFARVVAVVVALVTFGSAVQAGQPRYRPAFDKDTTVYVDPRAATNATLPVEFSSLAAELKTAGQKHNLTYYFVFVEESDENFNANTNYALPVLKELLSSWSNASGFDQDRHVLIVHTRKSGTRFGGKTAAEAGPALKRMGLTGSRFDQRNGPVMSSVFENMRNATPSHSKFVLGIAQHINEDLDAYVAANVPKATETAPQSPPENGNRTTYAPSAPSDGTGFTTTVVVLAIIVGGLGVVLLVLAVGSSRKAKRFDLQRQVNALRQTIKDAGRSIDAVENQLVVGARSQCNYIGETLEEHRVIASSVREIRTIIDLLTIQTDAAEAALNGGWSLAAVEAHLNSVTVSVGSAGPRLKAGNSYRLSYLVEMTGGTSPILSANEALKTKLATAKSYKDKVAQFREVKQEYIAAQLPYDLYEKAEAGSADAVAYMVAGVDVDPVKVVKDHAKTYQGVVNFHRDLAAGVSANRRVPLVLGSIDATTKAVTAFTETPVALDYPGKVATVDVASRKAAAEFELGCNPKNELDRATLALERGKACLSESRPLLAVTALDEADAAVASAREALRTRKNAKQSVESRIRGLESDVAEMHKRVVLPLGQLVVDTERDFSQEVSVRAEIKGQVAAAAGAYEKATSLLKDCATAYMAQKFVAAEGKATKANEAVAAGYASFASVTTSVQTLDKMRQRATETVDGAPELRHMLGREMPKGTTPETFALRDGILSKLGTLVGMLAAVGVNWRLAATQSDDIDKDVVAFGEAIKADKSKYDDALAKIAKAKSNGCPSSKQDSASAAADSGNYSATDGFLVGYMVASSSHSSSSGCSSGSSGSSCSSSSGSSCGGGGGCGGGGCGGGGCGGS